jgi:hypothetical protein
MASGTQGPASLLGRVVDGYRLTHVLGKGATGVVFLGERVEGAVRAVEQTGAAPLVLPDQAAIKLLVLPWQLDDAERIEFRKRFLREAETLSKLSHPHVLSVITYGEDQASDSSYIVLPYLAGGTLHDRLANQTQPMPLAEASNLLSQVADAIDFAHSQGIVHRDIKPGNVLLDGQGQAYLSDFSIARLVVEATTRLTRTGMALGTPIYMSPEALSGEPVGPAADVYSLGMVLYEMVTGLRSNATNPPPSPRALRPDLPVPAEAVILRAIESDPRERFASARELAQAFAEAIQGIWPTGFTRRVSGGQVVVAGSGGGNEPTWPAGGMPMPRQKPKRGRTGPVALLSVAATLLVVCSGIAFAMYGHLGPFAVVSVQATNTVGSVSMATSTVQPKVAPSPTGTSAPHLTPLPGTTPAPTHGQPTVAPTPLPTYIISTDASQSTDGQSHTAGNPYIFSGVQSFGNLVIQAGAFATAASHCNGGGTGTVQITAAGSVEIDGVIIVDGEGYCGGPGIPGSGGGMQGDSNTGAGIESDAANGGGGGGGNGSDGGGGGGGYGTAGGPSTNETGLTPSAGGNAYGDPTLSTSFLGSGGGSSGMVYANNGGAGGNGGGAVSIRAGSIVVTGSISANGLGGTKVCQSGNPTQCRGGGGGSGGSIFLHAYTVMLGNSLISATGGPGAWATGSSAQPAAGGNGGDGRIRVEYRQSVSGSTNPAASLAMF